MAPERVNIRSLRRQMQESVPELQCDPDERIGLAESIYREGKKTFAILILLVEEDYIVKFRQRSFLDDRLPLSNHDAQDVASDVGIRFANQQWELLSETFRAKMWESHHEFGMERILPFVGKPEQVGEGGFGEVVKVKILSSQQEFYPQGSNPVQVIRKRLKSKKITRELNNEKMFLRLLNQLQHPNIIRLLGSYTHREEHYFLFPCVDMDLKRFFEEQNRFGNFRWDFTFYSALRGLSNALSNVHLLRLNQEVHGVDFEAIGYHHDIRPANILVSQHTFLLADFGLGNLKPADAQSQTPFKPGVGDYLAPECGDEDQIFTRAIDVWAFGCLMAETATYMQKGSAGVKEFSNRRRSPARRARWYDRMFYGHDGNAKDEVKEWLKLLADGKSDECLTSSLVALSLQALIGNPDLRPKITHFCERLTFLSMKAHSVAVQHEFTEYLQRNSTSEVRDRTTATNLWFYRERFRAWSHSLALGQTELSTNLRTTLNQIHNKSTNIMANLVHKLEFGKNEKIYKSLTNEHADAQYAFENEIDQLVERLWGLLPATLQRHAQDYWHQAILCTENQGVLEDVHRKLKSRYTVYTITDAMAKMRKIRLKMLQPDSFEGAAEACIIALSDVKSTSNDGRHELGRYKDNVPILVERMRRTPAWDKVHPEQRKLVVGLKAKSLSVAPKPSSLKTLHCIGAFEEIGDNAGYGFVYRYPEGKESDPTTLLQRLVEGRKPETHPFLGDKFQLAFALADFLKEFHTIGWLHENFNSHNVLFWESPTNNDGSGLIISHELRQPYVVGLHKSRPDGSFWQTDGPGKNFEDYQHPEYASAERYRQIFDYYSLGVVLLEIGFWRPLSSWQSKFRDLGLAEVRSELIRICRTRLGVKMGVTYRDVVLRCIDGSLEGGLEESGPDGKAHVLSDGAAALGRFTERVVQPLEKLAVASI
ncbi:hypothetical protein DL768_010752 [Monosporascus sp. mg162]|nr:hypothetical protein DL768_010752 [Monosporascus sp. mg162]